MKRSLVLPVLLALAACSDSPDELLARARSAYAAQDFTAAKLDLAAALRTDPRNKAMLTLLVRSLLRLGDGDGALAAIERLKVEGVTGAELVRMEAEAALCRDQARQALDLLGGDQSAEAWRIKAAAQLKLGNVDAAIAAYRAGMEAGGGYLLSLDYGRFLLGSGDLAGAEAQLRALQGYDPNALATLLLAGDLYARQGHGDAAHAAWGQAARLYPGRAEPLLAEANAFDSEGKLDRAVALVEKAAALAPGNPEVEDLQIQLAGEKGDWEKVRTMLAPREATMSAISADGLAYAEALLHLGHPEQARAWFERAMLMSPNNPYSRLMAAEAQLATGDGRTALETVRPLADSLLAGPRELGLAKRAAEAAGDPAAAEFAARLQSAALKNAQALSAQGQGALMRHDWAAAVTAYSALAGLGEDAEVHKRLAFALSNAGRHDEAIAHADRALAMQGENPDMINIAGLTRLNAGRDRAEALRLLAAAAKRDPNSQQFKADLARAQAGS